MLDKRIQQIVKLERKMQDTCERKHVRGKSASFLTGWEGEDPILKVFLTFYLSSA